MVEFAELDCHIGRSVVLESTEVVALASGRSQTGMKGSTAAVVAVAAVGRPELVMSWD